MPEVVKPSPLVREKSQHKHPFLAGAFMFSAVVAVGILQILTPLTAMHWLYVLQRLYYLAIVVAGLYFGLWGSLAVAFMSGVFFLVGTPSVWKVSLVDALDQGLEVVVFMLVGLVTGILSDIQKRNEKDLRQTTEQLNSVYVQLQANFEGMKRAERLYALGQLSAGLAHEIRNPLASIEGAAAVVQRENDSEERRIEFLEIIQKECRRLDRLLSNFLDFAKPRTPQLGMVDVGELLDSVIVLAGHARNTGYVQLSKVVEAGPLRLECDHEQLKQVLLNLTMNALQATPDGKSVTLAAEQEETNLTIEVRDEGTGIRAGDLDRIFDPFFTTKDNGTGLGLSVAHQIVVQHQGTLTVSRNSPEGATFRIALPLRFGR